MSFPRIGAWLETDAAILLLGLEITSHPYLSETKVEIEVTAFTALTNLISPSMLLV
jgi:hypothetical protein